VSPQANSAATVDCARRRPSRPAEEQARRRLATLRYRYGEEQAQPKYGGGQWVPAASGAALAPLTIELVHDMAWSSSRRSGSRTVVASDLAPAYRAYRKRSFSRWLPITMMILAIVTGDPSSSGSPQR
jgi:hypothetical protein